MRILRGGFPEPFRREEPHGHGRRDTVAAADDHDTTIFLNRLMK